MLAQAKRPPRPAQEPADGAAANIKKLQIDSRRATRSEESLPGHRADPTGKCPFPGLPSLEIGLERRLDPASFKPVFCRRVAWGASEWCTGFLKATQLFNAEDWAALWAKDAFKAMGDDDRTSLVTPFLRLGDEAGMAMTDEAGDAQRWVDAIVPALVGIHAHWANHRKPSMGGVANAPVRRASPKVGRNDPCPCGSGRKFKHCCGEPQTLH